MINLFVYCSFVYFVRFPQALPFSPFLSVSQLFSVASAEYTEEQRRQWRRKRFAWASCVSFWLFLFSTSTQTQYLSVCTKGGVSTKVDFQVQAELNVHYKFHLDTKFRLRVILLSLGPSSETVNKPSGNNVAWFSFASCVTDKAKEWLVVV